MSIKPKLVCPPDYSVLVLRFAECKKLGVVKGTSTLLSTDLSNFAIPCTNFSERRFTLKPGKTQKLDISDIAVYWDLAETYNFIYEDAGVADGTTHQFDILDEDNQPLTSITFTIDAGNPLYATFPIAFATSLAGNLIAKDLITAEYGTGLSDVTVIAKSKGTKYNYLMTYDTLNVSLPGTYVHPGTLIQKSLKYPEGRVRAIFLYADYTRADVSTCTCGCTDTSGVLLSNVKNFQWAYDSDYTRKKTPNLLSGVIVNADAATPSQDNGNGTQTFQWLTTGNTAAYHLEVNELVTLNTLTNNPYGYITNIDGYNITVNRTGFGTGMSTDIIQKAWSPSAVEWKVAGEMIFLSGGQDVYDTDSLYTETIWIKNTQNYDVPFTAIIVS